ncbi:cytochrome c biogenesis protein CcdA [bacterium]|nr:cytochrome c biogenesis protein CcdA [bacterium]
MISIENISISIAFIAGLLSFASPCFFPFIPGYLSYMLGISVDQMRHTDLHDLRKITIIHSLFFIFGFTVVFVLLGMSASFLGSLLGAYRSVLSRIGGAVVIIFGLQMVGLFKIGVLSRKKKIHLEKDKSRRFYKSAIVGAVFALAWTPCIGPVLASVLLYASTAETIKLGASLLLAFSLGVAIPFFIASLFVNVVLKYFNKLGKALKVISIIGGVLLIFLGIILLLDKVTTITKYILS